MKDVTLKQVEAFMVTASDDEWGRKTNLIGYFSTSEKASIAAHKAGWYGSDGEVTPRRMLQDSNGNLYSADTVGKFVDIDQEHAKRMLQEIKAKLTPEEWAFYQTFSKQK